MKYLKKKYPDKVLSTMIMWNNFIIFDQKPQDGTYSVSTHWNTLIETIQLSILVQM